jgi:hypothetical protein
LPGCPALLAHGAAMLALIVAPLLVESRQMYHFYLKIKKLRRLTYHTQNRLSHNISHTKQKKRIELLSSIRKEWQSVDFR